MENLSFNEYQLVYNFFSFTFAAMAAGTLFSWLNLGSVSASYRPALVVTGLVTFIAAYHYLQIFVSFDGAYNAIDGVVSSTGEAFNVTYRYVDWLLTVPLLLVELLEENLVDLYKKQKSLDNEIEFQKSLNFITESEVA